MPGKQFATPGTKGSGETVAVSNRPEVAKVTATQTGSVGSGNNEFTYVYAPTGSIYRVRSLAMHVPADGTATTGKHIVSMRSANLSSLQDLQGRANYNTDLQFQWSHWLSADVAAYPPNGAAAKMAVESGIATEDSAIGFKYVNETDAAQDNDRDYRFVAEENTY